jgi:hypothetical protein
MFKPTNPNNLRKTNAVVKELKNTFNRRRNNLQRGEQSYEAIGQNTRRNASANKQYMNALRRGSSSPAVAPVQTYTPAQPSLTPYIKVSGVPSGTKGLSCRVQADGKYLCVPAVSGGKTLRRRRH